MSASARLRVLHFGKFTGRRFGGIETHVEALTEGLASAGLDVTNLIYDIGRRTGGVTERDVNGVHVVAVPCGRTLASLAIAPRTPGTVRRLSNEKPFDIVHAHFPDPLAYACLPFADGAARIASWHSDIVRQERLGKLYGLVARNLFDPLDAITGATPSHLLSPQMESFRPRKRYVVPYGVDLARFDPTAGTLAKADVLRRQAGGRKIVFALGRHVYYKGLDVLIDAFRHVDAVLMLGGEGPLTPSLQRQADAARGVGEIRFVGRIPEADLPAWYLACDVFCLPSLATSEAFGLVQIEAMGCGKPIVNCQLDNAVNFVAPDGVCASTVPPASADALAAALNRLLANADLRERLGAAGRVRVERHFSLDAMVDCTLAMYREVLANRSRDERRNAHVETAAARTVTLHPDR